MTKLFVLLLTVASILADDGPERFVPAVLMHNGDWDVRKEALPDLMVELMARTSVNASIKVKVISALDKDLFRYPLLFIYGSRKAFQFTEKERSRIRNFLEAGGMLVAEDISGFARGSEFDESFRREMELIFPDNAMIPLGVEHALFRSFYLIKRPYFAGRLLLSPRLDAIELESHTPVIYCRNDAAGAWEKARDGRFIRDVVPGGELQRAESFKFGVNAIMYALTLDYKRDAAHMRALMNRRGR